MMFKSPFWEKVALAAQRTEKNLYRRFKDLCALHTPIEEVSFMVSETGDGSNGYREPLSFGLGVELLHVSHWAAWEHVLKSFDPFNNRAAMPVDQV